MAPGGRASIHVTFAARISQLPTEATATTGIEYRHYRRSQAKIVRMNGEPEADPRMQMHHYDINELLCLLHDAGISIVFVQTIDHSGIFGAELCFERP